MPLDPQARSLLDMIESIGGPALGEQDPVATRETMKGLTAVMGAGPEVGSVTDRTIPGPAGAPEIPVRVYSPAGDGTRGMLVWYHGGGWVIGDLESADISARNLCAGAGVVVLSVDYRLAPEHPYPAGRDDCLAALRWARDHAAELGVDPARIAVGGDSAGGNLAAITALAIRGVAGPPLAFQLLVYPATDLLLTHPSIDENGEGYLLTKASMVWFSDHYLGKIGEGHDRKDPSVSPLYADDVSGVAPALVITAEFDPLRDEGEAYARKLSDAGVACTVTRYAGMIHAFFGMDAILDSAKQATAEASAALRGAIG